MAVKQGEENTELVKEEREPKENYVFQKNPKTKIGAAVVVVVLILIILAIVVSGVFFETPE